MIEIRTSSAPDEAAKSTDEPGSATEQGWTLKKERGREKQQRALNNHRDKELGQETELSGPTQ